jgi:protein-tyrosine phosphatase
MIDQSYIKHSQSAESKFDRNNVQNLLFLCFGNICRSPFAEIYWNKLVDNIGSIRSDVTSAGFVEKTGRTTPNRFIKMLRAFGADLSGHRSRLVSYDMLNTADAVLIMDLRVFDLLEQKYPEFVNKAELLRRFSNNEEIEMKDPWSLEDSEAIMSFKQIGDSLEGLLNFLNYRPMSQS